LVHIASHDGVVAAVPGPATTAILRHPHNGDRSIHWKPSDIIALPRNWRATLKAGVDHDGVLRQIGEEAGWSGRYAFLIVISAAISLLGLLMPSVAVLIGAMLLSPLMMPIIGLGFGIATLDFHDIRRAATALILGAVIAVTLSVVLIRLSPVQTITSEIAGRTQPTLFDLLVALLSAIAMATPTTVPPRPRINA
jgi:hypothetical protein